MSILDRVKFAHLTTDPESSPELAVVRDGVYATASSLGAHYRTLVELIEAGPEALADLREAAASRTFSTPVADASFGPAVIDPPAVLAVGLNYDEHASELALDRGTEPVLFSLFPNSLTGHGAEVPLPTRLSSEVDYEGELGVVIGRATKNVTAAEALDHVFGYTAVNDITARDIQFREPQWSRSKSFDGFTPIGPVVATADEIRDPQALRITTDLDGRRVQDSSTGHMIRPVAQLISLLSQSLTLMPGTVISTGSPGGAGHSRKPQLFLRPGSEVTVTIEGIGSLTNHCIEV